MNNEIKKELNNRFQSVQNQQSKTREQIEQFEAVSKEQIAAVSNLMEAGLFDEALKKAREHQGYILNQISIFSDRQEKNILTIDEINNR